MGCSASNVAFEGGNTSFKFAVTSSRIANPNSAPDKTTPVATGNEGQAANAGAAVMIALNQIPTKTLDQHRGDMTDLS